jgi:hypothetical protein
MSVQAIHTFPVAATEESQADKGIDHPLQTCGVCGAIWRARDRSRCPMDSCEEGTIMMLDASQSSNLFIAIYQLKLIGLSFTQPQMGFEFGKFRDLLRKNAQWYESTNRRMIQACYLNVRAFSACDPSDKTALAIEFFKNDYMWASDDKETFCREDDLNWRCPTEQ